MFEKFAEIPPLVLGILAALVLSGVVLYVITREKKKWSVRMIANAALCIALSAILSYVRLYKLPQGGSITPASMLPLFMFSCAYGIAPGMLIGGAYGLLQFIQEAAFVHPVQMILDYPLAFAMLGLAGISKRVSGKRGIILGILSGTFGRFLCAFVSGIVFYGMYAPEGQPVLLYSAIYNGLYLIPESAICIAVALVPQIRMITKQLALGK